MEILIFIVIGIAAYCFGLTQGNAEGRTKYMDEQNYTLREAKLKAFHDFSLAFSMNGVHLSALNPKIQSNAVVISYDSFLDLIARKQLAYSFPIEDINSTKEDFHINWFMIEGNKSREQVKKEMVEAGEMFALIIGHGKKYHD
tara:strand:- start:761 stop:1189 length:429 start_codon:yes stop_codon:yes gene_type:complete